jgi:chromosome segregation ATPase
VYQEEITGLSAELDAQRCQLTDREEQLASHEQDSQRSQAELQRVSEQLNQTRGQSESDARHSRHTRASLRTRAAASTAGELAAAERSRRPGGAGARELGDQTRRFSENRKWLTTGPPAGRGGVAVRRAGGEWRGRR